MAGFVRPGKDFGEDQCLSALHPRNCIRNKHHKFIALIALSLSLSSEETKEFQKQNRGILRFTFFTSNFDRGGPARVKEMVNGHGSALRFRTDGRLQADNLIAQALACKKQKAKPWSFQYAVAVLRNEICHFAFIFSENAGNQRKKLMTCPDPLSPSRPEARPARPLKRSIDAGPCFRQSGSSRGGKYAEFSYVAAEQGNVRIYGVIHTACPR